MNYWVTTHWPPRVDECDSQVCTGVWLPQGRQQAADDMQPGDQVAFYQFRYGRTSIRQFQDGTSLEVPCKLGRGGMICHGIVGARVSAIPDSQPTKYTDGTEIWWRWHAPVTVLSRSGFVNREDLLLILGYKPSWNLHAFGDYHSGLKKISKTEFAALIEAFHASRPVTLPAFTGNGAVSPHGGEEGPIHSKLKSYVASNPEKALNEAGLRTIGIEYRFPTNDCADIVMVDSYNRIIGVEIEPRVNDTELAGPLQAIKYRYMLECITRREPGDSRAVLVSHSIGATVKNVCAIYGVECHEIPLTTVDSWDRLGARQGHGLQDR